MFFGAYIKGNNYGLASSHSDVPNPTTSFYYIVSMKTNNLNKAILFVQLKASES